MLVVAFRFFDAPRRWHPAAFGALLAPASPPRSRRSSRSSWPGASSWSRSRAGARARRRCARRRSCAACSRSAGSRTRGASRPSSASTRSLFTTFLTHPSGIYGLWTGLDYWLGQHDVGRGGEAPVFYSVVLFAHEWPVLVLGAVGAVVAFRRPTLLRLFLVWAFVLSLVVYSWAGEKFAWLVLHPLLPLILLAGVGVQELWAARRTLPGKIGLAATALALAYTVYASVLVNAVHPADPREFLVSTQSSTDVADEAREIVALAERRGGKLKITIDSAEGATFPWAWYFRDLDVGYLDLSTDRRAAGRQRRDRPHPGLQHAPAADADRLRRPRRSASASGGCATTGKALARRTGGAGSARASRGTRPAGCRSGSTCGGGLRRRLAARSTAWREGGSRRRRGDSRECSPEAKRSPQRDGPPYPAAPHVPDRRARPGRTRAAELVPLGDPRVAVVRALDRPDDDVADPVAGEQRPARRPPRSAVYIARTSSARRPGSCSTAARGRPSRSPPGGR